MVIRFTCPNGHPLNSPDDLAGRMAKCRECGAPVRVPPSAGGEPPPAGGEEEMIVFLCPNSHRLHGPKSLEGRPGQCPHCGVKFRVPSSDDPYEEEDDAGSQILVGPADSGEFNLEGAKASPGSGGLDFNFNFETGGRGAVADAPVIDAGSGKQLDRHPLAELFFKLWDERARGAYVEIHLQDGVVLAPERFSRDLSRRTHGVFAVKDPDGTHTLTVVAWDAVARINVRRVGKLPKKMFD